MKKIAILGSTGSIGESTLEVVRHFNGEFSVEMISGMANVGLLEKQIREFNPKVAVIGSEEDAKVLSSNLDGSCEILYGPDGLLEASKKCDYDIFVGAIVGFSGFAPTIEAIRRGKRIALANKETLVVAGELITKLCQEYGAELIPVDSEHSAIFQCLLGEKTKSIKKIILTASGGPFFNKTPEELEKVTVREALDHPTWKMGSKITIDSATMMNKGLEVIEAYWLFHLPVDMIDVIVHPQSIIHSMVEFVDGSLKAQLSTPDMKLPIQLALTYPERRNGNFVETNFASIGNLTFFKPDPATFRCLRLAYDALEEGGTAPCIVNAANEIAVRKFLDGSIAFMQIPEIIDNTLNRMEIIHHPDLKTIYEQNKQARAMAESL